ncbi:MAG: VOC family protein [Pseudomonadota bacterium]
MPNDASDKEGVLGAVISLDHLVLTVGSIDATVAFYTRALGMGVETFGPEHRTALTFGPSKINLHAVERTFEPKAAAPTPGSADLCFVVDDLDAAVRRLERAGIAIIEGPVTRTGARGPIRSVYVRDPDANLIELSVYV